MYRKTYLFITVILVITLFFAIPQYNNWLFGFIMHPPISYEAQFAHLDPDERRVIRYGNSYDIYMQSVSVFKRANILDPVVLLPPPGYLREMGVFDVDAVEPSEFYYYTGYKAVFATSPDAEKATWAIVPRKPTVMLRRIHSKEDIDNLLNTYKQFKPRQ